MSRCLPVLLCPSCQDRTFILSWHKTKGEYRHLHICPTSSRIRISMGLYLLCAKSAVSVVSAGLGVWELKGLLSKD